MVQAPKQCPVCGEQEEWKISETGKKKGFNKKGAALGAVLLGPIGLLGGALGKPMVTIKCGKCGFECDYEVK